MTRAMGGNEIEGLRYDGDDAEVRRRIRQAGLESCLESVCDAERSRDDAS